MMNANAVIFDIDGVLVDSYEPHLRSWQMVAREGGINFSEDQFIAGFGRTSREIIQQVWGINDPEEIRTIDDRKEALYRDLVATDFPAMDGAVELIDALHAAGFALAMGSSGPPQNVQLTVERLGRREAFGAVVSGDDVPRGKPDPAIFQIAARRLSVPPQRCVVIEDAPAGVQAARAAGMACVVILSRGHKVGDFAQIQPDVMVKSLRELTPQRLSGLIHTRA